MRSFLESLVRDGLDAKKLREVVRKSRLEGKNLLDALIYSNLIDEVSLAKKLGSEYGIKVVDIGRVVPTKEALEKMGASFCIRQEVLPFSIERLSGDLLVAISDPENAMGVLDAFQARYEANIKVYVAPRATLKRLIARHCDQRKERWSTDELRIGLRNQPENGMIDGWYQQRSGRERSSGQATMPEIDVLGQSGLASLESGDDASINDFFSDDDRRFSGNNSFSERNSESRFGFSGNTSAFGSERDSLFSDGSNRGRSRLNKEAASSSRELASLRREARSLRNDLEARKKREEELREQIHRLEVSLQLEINLVRQALELLIESGVLDRKSYLNKLGKLK